MNALDTGPTTYPPLKGEPRSPKIRTKDYTGFVKLFYGIEVVFE